MAHSLWLILYGPYDMAHIICGIGYESYHMIKVSVRYWTVSISLMPSDQYQINRNIISDISYMISYRYRPYRMIL